MERIRISAIVGSLRKDSLNLQLALAAKELIGDRAAFSIIDYHDIPLMNQDIEFPPNLLNGYATKLNLQTGYGSSPPNTITFSPEF